MYNVLQFHRIDHVCPLFSKNLIKQGLPWTSDELTKSMMADGKNIKSMMADGKNIKSMMADGKNIKLPDSRKNNFTLFLSCRSWFGVQTGYALDTS